MRRGPGALSPLIVGVAVVLGWEMACRLLFVPIYLIPAPSKIAGAFERNAPMLARSSLFTLATALEALVFASLSATGLAVLVDLNKALARAIRPFASALQVTPVVAIAPLFVIWAGVDHPRRAIVALAAIVAFFPIFSGAVSGFRSADANLERLFDLHGASPWQRFRRLRLPSAVPFLLEGHRVAAGLAIVGAVVAEFVAGSGANQGLAWRILEAGNRLRTDEMFAALACLSFMAAALNAVLGLFEAHVLRWWRG